MISSVRVRAPSSTANLGPGFDVFGLALDAFYDEVKLTKKEKDLTIVTLDSIPKNPKKNTAGVVARYLIKKFKIKGGLELRIKKGVPAGYGMGSSAASAAATVVGMNKLFNLNLDDKSLVKIAGLGEKASAGAIHYDNVAASVLGGFVIVHSNPLRLTRIEPPEDLRLCIAVPQLKVPPMKTQILRKLIPKQVRLIDYVTNLSHAASIVAGFAKKDSELIGRSVIDVIVEPARHRLIPGFLEVKKKALDEGALGVTISGAGPSIIAFATKKQNLKKIANAMEAGFSSAKINSLAIVCKPSKGAVFV